MLHLLQKKHFRYSAIGVLSLFFVSLSAQAETFVWSSAGVADGASVNGSVIADDGAGTVTMTTTVSTVSGGAGVDLDAYSGVGQGPASYEGDGTFGGLSNFVEFGFDNDSCDDTDQFQVLLSFSQPVSNLQFTISDIDQSTWDDIIEIYIDVINDSMGLRNAKTLMSNTASGTPILTLGAAVVEDNETFADGYEGTANVGSGLTTGNINIDTSASGRAINSIAIRYFSGDDGSACGGGDPGSQRVGIGDVSFSGTTVPVTLSYFESKLMGDEVHFNWQTAQEVGHAGFQLYARQASEWSVLNHDLIKHHDRADSLAIKKYHYSIPYDDVKNPYEWLALVDVSMNEEVVPHGPYRLGNHYGGEIVEAEKFDWSGFEREVSLSKAQKSKVNQRIRSALSKEEQSQRGGR